jgi:threonine/homoserine/homoserine lactone efflux protein
MQFSQVTAFLLFAFIVAVTPGPANSLLLSTGVARGPLHGIPAAIGTACGMGTMIGLGAFGVGQSLAALPSVLLAMKLAGSVFLLWLALRILLSGGGVGQGRSAVGLTGAFFFQWLNPKGWLVAVSAAGAYLPAGGGNAGALWLGGLFAIAALPACLLWVTLGAGLVRLMDGGRRAHLINQFLAAGLAVSVGLIWL